MADSPTRRLKQRVKRRLMVTDPAVLERLDRLERRMSDVARDLARIGPQVAGLEARLEDLRQRLEAPEATPEERAEAVSLLTEMRKEHERIRARLTAATRFEERLRRVEDSVAR